MVVLALVVALGLAVSLGAMTGMGIAGGDGEPKNLLAGILGALVGYGGFWNVAMCIVAFGGLADWQWWSMLVPGAAGVLAMVVAVDDESVRDRVLGALLQLTLFAPAALVLASDRYAL